MRHDALMVKSAEMRQNCSTEIDILNREIEHLDKLAHGEH